MTVDKALGSSAQAIQARKRQGTKLYFASSVWAQICALVRYVLLARLLGPEQLGLAAILVLTASFFDLISDIGGDRFLIQDPDGDEERVQCLVQLALVFRGVSTAVALAVFALPVAHYYDAPVLGPAIIIFGLSPLIMGFQHLDIRRKQRHNDFRLEATCSLVSEAVGIVATVTAGLLTRDFTAVLWGTTTRSAASVLCSHVVAERPYRIGTSKGDASRLFRFSFPLMANGLILFLGGQGDRVLVGHEIGFAGLGQYSAVILLIYYPCAMLQRYVHAIYLPMIAASRSSKQELVRIGNSLGSQTLLLSLCMVIGFAIVAPKVVTVLYGQRFTLSVFIVAMIGGLQACRYLAVWPSTIALAMGRSTIVLASNFVRLTAWPAAWVGFLQIGGLEGIVTGFILGELTAFAASMIILNRAHQRPLATGFSQFTRVVVAMGITLGWARMIDHPSPTMIGTLCIASSVVCWSLIRSERHEISNAFSATRRILFKN